MLFRSKRAILLIGAAAATFGYCAQAFASSTTQAVSATFVQAAGISILQPLVLPTIGLVSVLTFVANFNAFDLIYSVKGALAGPNFASDILGTFFYRTFFGFQLQLGNPTMGAAVATVMFFIILVGVCLYLFIVQRRLRRYSF